MGSQDFEKNLIWNGDHTSWKDAGFPLSDHRVGAVAPGQTHDLLSRGKFADPDTPIGKLLFKDLNWKAMTGFLFSKDMAHWDVNEL